MSKKYFITISDIHNGHSPVENTEKEFYDEESSFFSTLLSVIDEDDFVGVFVTGDYYHKKLEMESKAAKLASQILIDTYSICKSHNKWLIFIRGTYSHDFRQLDNFYSLTNEYSKFKIINTVEAIDIEGMHTLCIPEEYMDNPTEYYADFFDKKYDLILGHGQFRYNAFEGYETEKPMARMPTFNEEEMISISNLVVFGHIHRHSVYKGHIYYNGSFSRNSFAEEEAKGFLMFEYDTNTGEHEYTFIENIHTPKYHTVIIERIIDFDEEEINVPAVAKTIKKYKEQNGFDFLKVKITADLVEKHPAEVEVLKGHFSTYSDIKIDCNLIKIKNNKEVMEELGIEQVNEDETVDELEFLKKEEGTLQWKILQFIQLKHSAKDVVITEDDILEAITPFKE